MTLAYKGVDCPGCGVARWRNKHFMIRIIKC